MTWFRRNRGSRDWTEAIRPELRDMPAPPPGDALLERIITSRAAGSRIILPDAQMPASRSSAHFLISAALVAALLLLAMPLIRGRRPETRAPRGPNAEHVASEWFAGGVAFANSVPGGGTPGLPRMELTRADRLRPATLEYARIWRDSTGATIGEMRGLLSMRPDDVDGVPAWRLVTHDSGSRRGRPVLAVDTVIVARDDLRPLRRTALVTPYLRYDEISIRQTFRGDSVTGRMNAKGADASAAGRPIARSVPAAFGPYIADAFAPVLLGAVQLHRRWAGSASIIGWAVVDGDVFIPIELRVEGEEQVTVPAGRFDCWRMSIRYSGRVLDYWVRKSDGIGVRLVQRRRPGEPARETVLLRGSSE